MAKKDFKDLNRRELVDLVYTMMEAETSEDGDLPTLEEVAEEQARLSYKARFRKLLRSTVSVLVVVAAVAVLISTLFLHSGVGKQYGTHPLKRRYYTFGKN